MTLGHDRGTSFTDIYDRLSVPLVPLFSLCSRLLYIGSSLDHFSDETSAFAIASQFQLGTITYCFSGRGVSRVAGPHVFIGTVWSMTINMADGT